MKVKKIVQEYIVRDVDQSVQFYETVLGFTLVVSEKEGEHMYWAKLANGNYEMSFKKKERVDREVEFMREVPIGGTCTMVLEVDNLVETYNEVQQQCEMLNHPHLTPCGASEFSLKDPDGYFITVEQPG